MKIYLSSYRIGNKPDRLLSSHAATARVAVIQNASDGNPDSEGRAKALRREFDELSNIGLEPEQVDLRRFFGKVDTLARHLDRFSYLWVTGGNAFVLRRAFALTGLDTWLIAQNAGDSVTYGGYSAGACVLTPTLKGIHLADEPELTPAGYESAPVIWEGLGLCPYCIAPHYRSDHPESPIIEKSVAYFLENAIPFVALRDGQAIVLGADRRSNETAGGDA